VTCQSCRPTVFVHTSNLQLLPALVGIHSLRTRGNIHGTLDVRLLRLEDTVLDRRRDGQEFRANGIKTWNHRHHYAFHFLRRRVPELMAYEGRALVVDPDVFAVDSVEPLLHADMGGKAILARYMPDGFLNDRRPYYSTGVMLLDCSKLRHWRWEDEINGLFDFSRDYWDLLQLAEEDPANIGVLDEQWNSLDRMDPGTRLLHFTRVSTQPWLTKLPMQDDIYDPTVRVSRITATWRRLQGRPRRVYKTHPDPGQERFFFDLLFDCLTKGTLPLSFVLAEIQAGRMRADGLEELKRSGFVTGNLERMAEQDMLAEFGISAAELEHDP